MPAIFSLSAVIVTLGLSIHSSRSSAISPLIVIFFVVLWLPVMILSSGSGIYNTVFLFFANVCIAQLFSH